MLLLNPYTSLGSFKDNRKYPQKNMSQQKLRSKQNIKLRCLRNAETFLKTINHLFYVNLYKLLILLLYESQFWRCLCMILFTFVWLSDLTVWTLKKCKQNINKFLRIFTLCLSSYTLNIRCMSHKKHTEQWKTWSQQASTYFIGRPRPAYTLCFIYYYILAGFLQELGASQLATILSTI